MTDQEFLKRINDYAEIKLADVDPQKVRISEQLERLKPVMEELSKETGLPMDEVFIKYMDLASEASAKREAQFKQDFQDVIIERPGIQQKKCSFHVE